jgi:hypothetical protein
MEMQSDVARSESPQGLTSDNEYRLLNHMAHSDERFAWLERYLDFVPTDFLIFGRLGTCLVAIQLSAKKSVIRPAAHSFFD